MARPCSGRTVVIAVLVALAAVVAGCATGTPRGTAAGATGTPAGHPATTPAGTGSGTPGAGPVPELLRFTATTVDGGRFDAATLAGAPAVLWFWAAWCPRCQAKAAEVVQAQTKYAGRAAIVGVAGLGSGAEPMRRFVSGHAMDGFPNLADDGGAVWRRFGVTEQEFFVILDAHGAIVHKGALPAGELDRRLAALTG